eukprot:CAMPEP_0184690786 /NCGR_PEP_ID=MMETSP0312-20130426/31434_1 /TAXON_ID=31354 /ORGANISM="Compsopogon coeruleus, Strain SAG 36.94" /LENGTH=74 /DNA_ID=CAMNT_0027148341 /DNA_START=491 /DNA_END=712 /DNA_ORIENTATION=-
MTPEDIPTLRTVEPKEFSSGVNRADLCGVGCSLRLFGALLPIQEIQVTCEHAKSSSGSSSVTRIATSMVFYPSN